MNLIDMLLATDIEKLKEGLKKEYEIKRLSEKLGKTFIVTCYPLTPEQTEHLIEISDGKLANIKVNAVLEACKIEGQKINNKDLMEKFNVVTAKGLVEQLFLIGEITALYEVINDISGYGKDSVKEIKNY